MARNVATTVDRSEYYKRWYLSRKEKHRDQYLQRTYGMTLGGFYDMLDSQNNQCGICEKDLSEVHPKNIHIDHCHNTDTVRGVLCQTCNMGMGMFEDNIETLEAAIRYLEKSHDA